MIAQPLDAPRGFVAAAEHYRALARIDALEEELAYLKSMLPRFRPPSDPMTDFMARRLGVKQFVARDLAAMMRAYPDPIPNTKRKASCHVAACALRRAINAIGGPPSAIRTIYATGYCLTNEGYRWASKAFPGALQK